jgi:hypothetical protein
MKKERHPLQDTMNMLLLLLLGVYIVIESIVVIMACVIIYSIIRF